MRLIDADALKEFVKEKCSYCTSFIGEEDVLAWIDKAPTIEPNELDLDIDYSIEYDKRPDGISNAKVTITRIKPKTIEKTIVNKCDLISREDAIEVVDDTDWYHINKKGEMVQGAASETEAWYKAEDIYKALNELPSADAEPKRVPQGYCKGADCRWWNPQVNGCNRCVMIQDEYTHTSAEPSGDLISRDDAIEECYRQAKGQHNILYPEDVDDILSFLPSADRPKGEWKENDALGWKCSRCGIITNLESNFCPNCGADMRKDQDR